MSYCVIVSGLPKNVRRQKMVHFLKTYVFKKPPLQFWIESMSPPGSNDLKDMLIRFETEAAADFAASTLQDYPYQHTDQQIYNLKCWIKNNAATNMDSQEFANDVKIERNITPVEFQRPYSPVRDRSPHMREELTKLELEIELTNKKRMLLEAERNLLLEQKRLEMLQKAGTPDVPVEDSTQSSTTNPAPLTILPKKRDRKRPQDQNPNPGETTKKLYWPCKFIMKDMHHCIKRNVHAQQISLFNALLRNVVKKRLSDILGDDHNHNSKKCISLYRTLYPKDVDEDFVIAMKNMMLQGQLPPELLAGPCPKPGTSNANMTNSNNTVDPADLPISELSKDLDDWTEEATASDI